jgi:ribosomal protein S18 acetylase RimI-like enzyme
MILKDVPLPALRPMTPDDVDPAAEMILSHDWGVRREWLAFTAAQPACVPFVADDGGEIVATGVGTANPPAGWIGTIFVAPAWRGRGLGRAITQAIIDRLESAGCRTLVLVATREGRLLYERMGFEVQSRYRILEAPGLAGDLPQDVRSFEAADLDALAALDGAATGEDRRHALERLADPATARVALGHDRAIEAFVVRPPWGGGATIGRTREAALDIVHARRVVAGPTGRVRVGVLDENEAGLEALAGLGFVARWSAPRMVRGAPLPWHAERIWGQFNHAMG